MFSDDYLKKIGLATENEAKAALYKFLYAEYRTRAGVVSQALGSETGDAHDEDFSAKLAVAVTNRVFGETASNDAGKKFGEENEKLISHHASRLSSNEKLCGIMSGAAYNTCYARFLRAGGKRGIFSNKLLAYVRALSGLNQGDESLMQLSVSLFGEIRDSLGADILAPLESMQSLGIFRPLARNPNEREYYNAVHQFAMSVAVGSS